MASATAARAAAPAAPSSRCCCCRSARRQSREDGRHQHHLGETLVNCCLENRLAKPDSGLSRLNCGVMGLKQKIHPRAHGGRSRRRWSANARLASTPTPAMVCSRCSMVPVACTVAGVKHQLLAPRALQVFHEPGRQRQQPQRAHAQDGQVRQIPRAAVWPSLRASAACARLRGVVCLGWSSWWRDCRGHAIVESRAELKPNKGPGRRYS